MKTLSDWVLLQEEEDRGQQQLQLQQQGHVVFHVLSVLLAAQYSCCSKGLLLLGAAADSSSAGYNAICDPQVRAAMLQGVQLLISALDIDHHHHHHHIDSHHIAAAAAAPHPLMHFNKDTDGRRLVGLCSLMLQVCTVCYVLSVDDS